MSQNIKNLSKLVRQSSNRWLFQQNRVQTLSLNNSSIFVKNAINNNNSNKNINVKYFSTKTETQQDLDVDKFDYTNKLEPQVLKDYIPCYTVMDQEGVVNPPSADPNFGQELVTKMYKQMLLLNTMDSIFYDVQRQGRISFYMTSFGEEAIHIGSAQALSMDDTIFAQYRESGVLMWRGFTLDEIANQCCSNELDPGKGRQMPVHFGSKRINVQTISSPLTTQLPQAVGSSYAQKLAGEKNCTIVYFGEGAASEGDFHAAMNFAATLSTPTIFFCRNNKWAISTPASEQYRGDGIAGRGPSAYGMTTFRVDGNDIWAVYNVTKMARDIAVEKGVPVLIEAMTYRVSHHSTSDDSSRYRTTEEINHWKEKKNPVNRLKNYMIRKGWWTEELEKSTIKESREQVKAALQKAEAQKKPMISELFTDVYDTIPNNLLEQQKELIEHIKLYPEEYPIDQYAPEK
ncbi:3-methyl-2-oxobutanoate dehydrogenase [Heterostelium album PN500]|uniref:2-oxoisovalerate dehydrogenase subunit alpha n=1 Tax=Heterostelium pallidum (strain ATCC 26659 / Pp 5 / PN500) TaxID=670386 RepID=D3AZG6_HETP5|nr:3-methyl-2-oxobutanoate dehydrogenase [Heterostelium album PN500]EFA85549.1 3-methyl-2-oxobutanoate dehydrogenase [Heterostelium album PN500]|eukprot:XP_020437657.1 3-methyl-2-oxobutanoate dehydrogenase [Heterostelium album PN500]